MATLTTAIVTATATATTTIDTPTNSSTASTATNTTPTDSTEAAAAAAASTTAHKMVVPTQQQIHDLLNLGAFKQLLEMDDPEDEIPFSREITGSFFEQARSTLVSMDGALSRRDVIELGRLGHYLKGSSAVIGLRKVTTDCERIQILGNGNGNNEHATSDRDKLLENMGEAIVSLRANIVEAEPFIQSVFNALENNQVKL